MNLPSLRPVGLISILPVLLLSSGCSSSSIYVAPTVRQELPTPEPPEEDVAFELYLIGDAGGSTAPESEPALGLLRRLTADADSNSAVIFLGDNVYCCGLPDSSEAGRAAAEMRLLAQIDAVRHYAGRVVFVPGNHDWGQGAVQDVERVRRQEAFVEAQLNGRNVFLPDNGLPGPIEVKLKDGLRLVVLDTQWWMTPADKPYGDSGKAEIHEDADFILELEDLLLKRRKDDVVVVGHHPIVSNGRHAGRFSLEDHLFPLTAVHDDLYLPLPVLGSLYPVLRRLAGGPQDFSNPKYRSFRSALTTLFEVHEGRLVYASGHEHSLQYFADGHVHHLISGSGSRSDYAAGGGDALFVSESEGFMRVRFYRNGEMWLEAFGENAEGEAGLLFKTRMEGPQSAAVADRVEPPDDVGRVIPADSTVFVAALPGLEAGGLHRLLFGSEHRRAWTERVRLPVFDLASAAPGLVPIKRGGSLQTTSLRLQDERGYQYVLRSVNKDPTRSLPEGLERTIAANIAVDQLAIMHPFAALLAAPLAEAAGVYHANPRIVYVPRDERFAPYTDLVAEQPMLFEERPDEDMSHAPTFGRSKNVVGTVSMTRRVTADNDDRVDERVFARARLFDMYISDWDRHPDQWRWASFPAESWKGTVYRAIPRDRDWAFSRMNGLFPSITKSRFVIPKFQDFRESYGFIRGLNGNALPQDRRFTGSLSREDWLDIAHDIQAGLTDAAIDSALAAWPIEIRQLYDEEYRRLLRIRRKRLPEAAMEYYELLALTPDVIGSNKHERFEIRRIDASATEVVVFKTSKAGETRREISRRTFFDAETKEIRLYGLGGNDVFVLEGPGASSIRIRAIGGPGRDRFVERSSGARKGTFVVYDTPGETVVEPGASIKLRLSDDAMVNRYDPQEYGFTDFMPTLYLGSNQDDGLFLGGGVTVTTPGFRKRPFATRHTIRANVSTVTQAFNIDYRGRFTRALGGWDVGVTSFVKTPNHIRNYYGLGNESANTAERASFYQARFAELALGIRILRPMGDFFEWWAGPTLEVTDIRKDSLRFVGQPEAGISTSTFDDQVFLALGSGFSIDGRDSPVYPRQGFLWDGSLSIRTGLQSASTDFAQFTSDFSFYLTPSSTPKHTFAVRIGVRHNAGSFPFFRSSTLGGKLNLRGWRTTRFAGRTAFYQNLEWRVRLFRYASLLAVGSGGVMAFFDNGRVWTDGEGSSRWHQGFGGGVWFNVFDASIIKATFGFSKEETVFTLGVGFLY